LIYLDTNGVTIKACEYANIGDTGVIDGVTYTVVDEAMLRAMAFGLPEDLTKVVTTFVTDMSTMFGNTLYDFNQNINSWDVSNVTTMAYMFSNMDYNQPIVDWDVSSVTDMRFMFLDNGTFNQPIGNWDVSSVTDMSSMFSGYFNNEFNQDISNWDVSSVTDMSTMFQNNSAFNQPIGDWDVSSVTDMRQMFANVFATSGSEFNQDLSNWNVSSVNECSGFSADNPQWTLPKPNLDPSCLE
ncbi:BspA family leucine-rich repeat surface protein, partial [Flavobacteriaceae bacterium]|nr:BspA family leucine-rich repeat surface protein [Flavobacteriaceae bacterium]